MSIHLRPTAPLAERALLPADPGLALGLAQVLLEGPRMFNHNRGLWGYTGVASDGLPLTVQSTGIGGPSAAIVLEELADLGLRRAIRVGTCSAIGPTSPVGLGDLLIVEAAVPADGTSRALQAGGPVPADDGLTAAMTAATRPTRRGVIVSTDLFYGPDDGDSARLIRQARAVAVDLETAAVFTVGRLRSVAVACVVVVADLLTDARRVRIDDQSLDDAVQRAGRLAAGGLIADQGDPRGAPARGVSGRKDSRY